MLNEIKELITFSAFRPSKGDARYSLKDRFNEEAFLGVILKGKGALLAKIQFSKAGIPQIEFTQEVETAQKEDLIAAISEYSQKHKLTYATVTLNTDLEILPFSGEVSDSSNLPEVISLNPESILGTLCDRDQKYLYLGSRQRTIEYLFCYGKNKVSEVVELIESAGLKIARLACPIQSALFKASEQPQDLAVFVYMNQNYVFAQKKDQKWIDLSFKTQIDPLTFIKSALEALGALDEDLQEVQLFTDVEVDLEDQRIKNKFENNLMSPLYTTVAS